MRLLALKILCAGLLAYAASLLSAERGHGPSQLTRGETLRISDAATSSPALRIAEGAMMGGRVA